ncbi:hypothetical protein HMH01_09430 [Halovulum dunhuangense]|uniref:Glycosyl transferase family 8 n=1 Tax=Halovulum dunhuangense TaxID=1505036 RepID=A0A849L2V4_9RHOB|nr:hypothetical protein [Halovulum dunhuangense]NNU80656.1 hypothetical protein [Halovulum dunhuangense]
MKLTIAIIAQNGRLQYEAVLFVETARYFCGDKVDIYILIPRRGENWSNEPDNINPQILDYFVKSGCHIVPFKNEIWGQSYPEGNKICCLRELPAGRPFIFFDSDQIITADVSELKFDFSHPLVSPGGHMFPVQGQDQKFSTEEYWRAVYEVCSETPRKANAREDIKDSFPYYNAGCFGFEDPAQFHEKWMHFACLVDRSQHEIVLDQPKRPWLDQITLPVVCSHFGGADENALHGVFNNGTHSYHYHYPAKLCLTDQYWELKKQGLFESLKYILEKHQPFQRIFYTETDQLVLNFWRWANRNLMYKNGSGLRPTHILGRAGLGER